MILQAPDKSDASSVPSVGSLHGALLLLQLEQQLRNAPSRAELSFHLVQDSAQLAHHDVAALWLEGRTGGSIAAVANLPEPVTGAPFTQWLKRLFADFDQSDILESRLLTATDCTTGLAKDWADFLPAHALIVPLISPAGHRHGALLMARANPWTKEEQRLTGRLGETAAHALDALTGGAGKKPVKPQRWRRRRYVLPALAIAFVLVMLVPVRLTVLASAEVTAKEPYVVRAPLDGVIDSVLVAPNQTIVPGDALVRLDDTDLTARLDVASRDLQIAQAELRQAQQTAFRDAESASRLAILAGRVEQAQSERAYLQSLYDRISVTAERGGIALISDEADLAGKPVRLGERILSVADPAQVRVTAWLAVDDAVPLSTGRRADLFLNILATRPIATQVTAIDFKASQSPEGVLGYRVQADFTTKDKIPRVGQRGTLKLRGEKVPLFVYLFRKPWAAIRPRLGI